MHRVMNVLIMLALCATAGCSTRPSATAATAATATLIPTPEHTPNAITVTNREGFPLTLRSVLRDGDQIKAVFCFVMPSDDDWQLGSRAFDVIITAGVSNSAGSGGGIVNDTGKPGAKRCLYTLFPTQGWQSVSKVKISIAKIATSMPEVPDCQKAQAKLNQKLIPIKIACQPGDHSFHWEVSDKPATLSMEKAREVAFDEGLVDTIIGPWIFESGFFAASAE